VINNGGDDWHEALVRARCARAIAYAQYRRALTIAKTAGGAERAAAFAEAHRLLGVAAVLRDQANALQAEHTERARPPKR
jgi:hypothetical protein